MSDWKLTGQIRALGSAVTPGREIIQAVRNTLDTRLAAATNIGGGATLSNLQTSYDATLAEMTFSFDVADDPDWATFKTRVQQLFGTLPIRGRVAVETPDGEDDWMLAGVSDSLWQFALRTRPPRTIYETEARTVVVP